MKTGVVKFFNVNKDYGFIKADNEEKEYFVHQSGLTDEIKEGDKVKFDLQESRKGKGPNCVNVQLA